MGISKTTDRPDLAPFKGAYDGKIHILLIYRRIKKLFGLDDKPAPGLVRVHGSSIAVDGKLQNRDLGQGRTDLGFDYPSAEHHHFALIDIRCLLQCCERTVICHHGSGLLGNSRGTARQEDRGKDAK